MIVVDASVVVRAVLAERVRRALPDDLHAPALLWSETASTLRQLMWRGEADPGLAREGLAWLIQAPITRHDDPALLERAWRISDELGWAKTYDAEYVGLARFLGAPLLTVDSRLRRGASKVIEVIGPTEV